MRNRFLGLLAAASASLAIAATTVMPAAASPVTLNCSATVGMKTYTGSITVDSSRIDHLEVGDTVKLRNGLTAKVISAYTAPNQLDGTAQLSTGQTATVHCTY